MVGKCRISTVGSYVSNIRYQHAKIVDDSRKCVEYATTQTKHTIKFENRIITSYSCIYFVLIQHSIGFFDAMKDQVTTLNRQKDQIKLT
jgi:hypothetical protein